MADLITTLTTRVLATGFLLAGWVPVLVVAGVLATPVVVAWGPADAVTWWDSRSATQQGALAAATLAGTLLAAAVSRVLPLVPVATGHAWPAWLAERATGRRHRRFACLQNLANDGRCPAESGSAACPACRHRRPAGRDGHRPVGSTTDGVTQRERDRREDRRRRAERELARHWPDARRVGPTGLGDRLAVAETHAEDAYGLDLELWLPRLLLVLPDPAVAALRAAAVPVVVCLAVSMWAPVLGAALVVAAWWGLGLTGLVLLGTSAGIVGAALVLAWAGRRLAVSAATRYGHLLAAVVDVHRHRVLQGMRVPLPRDLESERRLWRALSESYAFRVPVWDVTPHPPLSAGSVQNPELFPFPLAPGEKAGSGSGKPPESGPGGPADGSVTVGPQRRPGDAVAG